MTTECDGNLVLLRERPPLSSEFETAKSEISQHGVHAASSDIS